MKHTFSVMDRIGYALLGIGLAGAFTMVYTGSTVAEDDCRHHLTHGKTMKVTEVPARKDCICREVASVVKEQAYNGLITYEQAERIASKCWRIDF